jgi:hypothetical protein
MILLLKLMVLFLLLFFSFELRNLNVGSIFEEFELNYVEI